MPASALGSRGCGGDFYHSIHPRIYAGMDRISRYFLTGSASDYELINLLLRNNLINNMHDCGRLWKTSGCLRQRE